MSQKNGRRYSEDFRKMIVELYHSGKSVNELVGEYGVSDVSIYNWIREYTPMEPTNNESLTLKDAADLQKENLR